MKKEPVRILIVDDEQDLLWALRYNLSDEGYKVLTAHNGLQGLSLAQQFHPDLVILDIVMPDMDGLEVCRRLRRDPNLGAVPILFLTVRNDVESRVRGLNEGSDDYLVKPFDMRELKARIKVLLRRSRLTAKGVPRPEDHMLVAGDVALDLHSSQVHVAGKTINLTPTEFGLLRFFMLHPGEVFSSEKLLETLWGYARGTATLGLVRWHIKNLRSKIEPDPSHPIYIRTMPRHGYVWFL